ncbi:MAG: AI-2E family transporter [Anaerobiospirillum succiniciproducens]|uniref:AI-2E family transporter n=1 Tax=Anaerobiospirillum succiniciproducens TaxID=13335 RepID=UPI0026DB9A4F|nr:AI-2E family transporter [Anaerobiospirillum succiniciproducens]MDO4675301.1 AI-2E family transporter [Anaerobiospirillum succiniciproducens]
MSHNRELIFEWTLIGLLLILGGLLFVQAMPFLNGTLGAITLYILLRRTNIYLANRLSPGLAPWILTIAVAVFVVLPFSAAIWYIIELINNLDFDINVVMKRFADTIKYLESTTKLDLVSEKSIAFATAKVTAFMNSLVAGINDAAINLFTALLILFFLLAGGIRMERGIARCLPFNDRNKTIVINKVSTIVKSNAIGIPLLAMIQGTVAAVGYYICGVNNPIEFGVLTGFASMIPIVGSMLVWIPLAIVQYFEQGMLPALYISLYGIVVISQSDNVLRMIVQKRMADTHPLVTIFGVIAGLPLFGFMGLIFGPLLVAMFLLFLEMFIKQYITCEYANEEKGSNSRANSRQDKWALKNANPNAPQNKLEAQKKRPSQEEGVSGFGLLGKMMNRAQAKNDNAAPLKDSASKRTLKENDSKRDLKDNDSKRTLNDNVKKRDLQDSKLASDGKLPRDSRSKASSALKDKSQDKTFNETKSADGAKSKELKSQDLKSQDNKSKDLRKSSSSQDKNVAADTSSTANAKASAADNANNLAATKDATAVKDTAASKNAAAKNDFKSAKADAKHQKREAAKLRAAEEQKALERQMARDVLSNETRPAVNLAERFNERNEHLDNAGRTLVARAISDAIGSFDKFDDIEGSMQYAGTSDLFKDDYLTDETKAAIAKRHNRNKRTEDSVYGEPIKHSRTDETEAKSSKSSQDKRKGLDSKRQGNNERKSSNSDNVSASASDSAKLDPYHTQGSSSTKAESNSSRHSDRQSRRQRNKEEGANASSSRNDKKTSTQKRTNERKQSAKDAPKGKAKSSRNNRRVNSVDDYYARSASRRSEYDMPMFETVVAHNYGGNGSSRRPQLRTQLVSMYTAKGTVKAEPRRRPSKKRPHHR